MGTNLSKIGLSCFLVSFAFIYIAKKTYMVNKNGKKITNTAFWKKLCTLIISSALFINVDRKKMPSYYECLSDKDPGQRMIPLLLVFLLLPETAEKDLSGISLYYTKPLHHIVKESHASFYPLYDKSLCLFTTQLYTILQSSYQELRATSCSLPSSLFFDFQPKVIVNRHSQHLESTWLDTYALFIGDVHKTSHYIVIITIWMYQYHQAIKMKTASEILTLRREEGKSNETAESQVLPMFVIVSFSALGICTVMGFFTNSFIIVVHGMERLKGRKINPRELILFTLGLFNIAFQCTMVANDSLLFLWSDVYFLESVYTIFSILLLFTIFSSFWLMFSLCGFYYLMLLTYKQTFFIRLKQSISDVVSWMLFFSVIISFIISVPVAWNIKKEEYRDQLGGNLTGNVTVHYGTPHMSLQYLLVTSIIGCCIPLILVAIANFAIIKCLYLHAKQLKKSAAGMSVQSVEASVSAAYTVTSLLILYITFYISETLLIMDIFKVDSPWISGCLVTVYSYAPIQSIILILGSPKLREVICHWLCSRKVTDIVPSDNRTTSASSVSILTINNCDQKSYPP